LREHARFCVTTVGWHAPAEHAYRVTLRVSSGAVLAHFA
jgi:hypothetical protein